MPIELTAESEVIQVRLSGIHGPLAFKQRLEIPAHLITASR